MPQSSDITSVGGTDTADASDVAEALKGDVAEETEETTDDKEDKEDKESDEGIDVENEEEAELEETEDEDKIDLREDDAITSPPKRKEIAAKYPKFFKEFPWFEKMMYRDVKMQERFGSFDDAMEAADKAEAFDDMQSSVLSGNPEKFLSEVKEGDDKAFKKFIDNFLPTLAKVDKDAYKEVAQDVTRLIISSMVKDAKMSKNDEARKALEDLAESVNEYIFGTTEFVPKKKAEDFEDNKIEQERKQFQQERLQVAVTDVTGKVTKLVKSYIDQNIDPKNEMTSYVKKNAIRECMETLDNMIEEDSSFKRMLTKEWQLAAKNKLPQSALDKIKSMWLGKAKRALPIAIRKVRSDALKNSAPARKENKTDSEESKTRRSTSSQSGNNNKGARKPGESAYDFMMRE